MSVQKFADDQQVELIFPAVQSVYSDHHTGKVSCSLLKNSGNAEIVHFLFQVGSRNDWHYHPNAEQTLLVLDGEGFYQEEGRKKQVIHKGNVVVTSPNVRHWNGAVPNKAVVFISISEHSDSTHVVWLDKVSNEEDNR